jgi:hypothetical protein
MKGFTNADCASSLSDKRSTIGYCTFLGGKGSHKKRINMVAMLPSRIWFSNSYFHVTIL